MDGTNSAQLIEDISRLTNELKENWSLFQKDYGKRRPLVIEFSGTPKSGKSTTLAAVTKFLRKAGLDVKVVEERASLCPLEDKEHFSFNAWTACQSLIGLLEGVYPLDDKSSKFNEDKSDPDIIILDRGLFDVLVWVHWLRSAGKMLSAEADAFINFFTLPAFARVTDLVLTFRCDPQVALRREALVTMRTETGRIMNPATVKHYNDSLLQAQQEYGKKFTKVKNLDTTELDLEDTVLSTLANITAMLDEAMNEQVLCMDMARFEQLGIGPGFVTDPAQCDMVLEALDQSKVFVARKSAESDFSRIQPIVCLVIRNQGSVFLLRRSEPDRKHRLHEQYVVWAGGHVRIEDSKESIRETLAFALEREIDEELRVKSDLTPKLMGVVYDMSKDKSHIHFGVVYVVDIDSTEVSLAISQREFKERRGTSLSGSFQTLKSLSDSGIELEPWSAYVIESLGGSVKRPLQHKLSV